MGFRTVLDSTSTPEQHRGKILHTHGPATSRLLPYYAVVRMVAMAQSSVNLRSSWSWRCLGDTKILPL